MKKTGILMLLVFVLTGCSAQETFETVGDVYSPQNLTSPKQISLSLPDDAAMTVMEGDDGKLYLCSDYEIMVQTLSAGDLNATFRSVTGFPRDRITVMETVQGEHEKYECVWTSAGETGDQVGRAVILDDGQYHYCLTVMAAADDAGSLQAQWQSLIDSFGIT